MDDTMHKDMMDLLNGLRRPKNAVERKISRIYKRFNHNQLTNNVLKDYWNSV